MGETNRLDVGHQLKHVSIALRLVQIHWTIQEVQHSHDLLLIHRSQKGFLSLASKLPL